MKLKEEQCIEILEKKLRPMILVAIILQDELVFSIFMGLYVY